MSENTVHPAPEADAVSPELANHFLDHTDDKPEAQPDKPAATEEATATDEKDADDEPEATPGADEETPEAGTEATPEKKTADPEDLNPADQTYEVAGKTYESFDEAVTAIKKIAGDNTRMAGELKSLQTQVQEYETKYNQAVDYNQQWQKYYEGKGEAPPAVAEDIEAVVAKVLAKQENDKSRAQLQTQYAKELESLPAEKDYADVYPIMLDLANRLGNEISKISPKELFLSARGIKNGNAAPNPSIDKVVADTKEKAAKKAAAAKVMGGGKGRSPAKVEEPISPELANYFGQR